MKRSLILAWALISGATQAADISGSLTLSPEWRTDNTGSPYFVSAPVVSARHQAIRQDLGLRIQEGGFNAQGIVRFDAAEGQQVDQRGIVNQLYFDGEIGPGKGWTLGRKVMTWGVGYGFRPLDVVQREDRRGINPPPLTGIPLLAWDSFSADEALTVVWQRPGSGRGVTASQDAALAAHWYRLVAGTDLHAVARVSERNGLEAGAGFSSAFGEEWSFHGAALNQRRYAKRLNRLAETDVGVLATQSPLVELSDSNAVKAVAGAQWTNESGFGILLEAWYDGEAYLRSEWQRLNGLTRLQRGLAGIAPRSAIDGNVAWSSQAFTSPNLMRENLMTRFSYDVDQRWKSAFEWVVTPRDGGHAITLSLSHEGNRQRLGGGIRWLGGAADSALAQAPLRRAVWLEWRLALP